MLCVSSLSDMLLASANTDAAWSVSPTCAEGAAFGPIHTSGFANPTFKMGLRTHYPHGRLLWTLRTRKNTCACLLTKVRYHSVAGTAHKSPRHIVACHSGVGVVGALDEDVVVAVFFRVVLAFSAWCVVFRLLCVCASLCLCLCRLCCLLFTRERSGTKEDAKKCTTTVVGCRK